MTAQNEQTSSDFREEEIPLEDGGTAAESMAPPTLSTSEFEFPFGDSIELPDAADDPASVYERIIDENDLLPAWFLERGAVVQRAVGRVVLTKPHTVSGFTFPPGTGWATGFMVSPSLFMTNNHVIPDEAFADKIRMQFNYQLGPDGVEMVSESYYPDASDVFHTNRALDYTVIRLRGNHSDDVDTPLEAGAVWGIVELNPSPTFRSKQHFNIVQHPSGRRKEVALQDNEIDKLSASYVRYKADTEPGSSGSPVFNNLWQIVALHHAGGDKEGDTWLNNEGIRIDAVVNDLREHFTAEGRPEILAELGIADT